MSEGNCAFTQWHLFILHFLTKKYIYTFFRDKIEPSCPKFPSSRTYYTTILHRALIHFFPGSSIYNFHVNCWHKQFNKTQIYLTLILSFMLWFQNTMLLEPSYYILISYVLNILKSIKSLYFLLFKQKTPPPPHSNTQSCRS